MEATFLRDYTGKESAEAIVQLEQDGFRPMLSVKVERLEVNIRRTGY